MIREPNGYYLVIKDWHRDACPDNACASALLSFLMFFHRHKQTLKEYAKITNQMLKSQNKPPVADETDWQFHTDEQLKKRLFFWKEEATIKKAITYLEKLGFIRTDAPEELRKFYKAGRTKFFMIREKPIREFLKRYDLDDETEETLPAMQPMERKYKPAEERRDIAKRIFRFRFLYHNEEIPSMDEKRLSKITARLREGKDELSCVQAVIGNKLNAWYAGENQHSKNGKTVTFHLIRHIFKDSETTEGFIKDAENEGINRDRARSIYQKTLGIELDQPDQEKESEQNIITETRVYTTAGAMLKKLVVDEKKTMDQCFEEFCNRSSELSFSVRELTSSEKLAEAIINILSEHEIVQESRKGKIQQFAEKFINKLKNG